MGKIPECKSKGGKRKGQCSLWFNSGNDVTPDMKDLSGVFKKSPKGILRVWYSADERRIPLRISSKVIVGSFTAKLINAKNLLKRKN